MARFPSLNALRTFEAAARHGSFTAAAGELNVTPGAISRQIKYLEETLRLELFERGHREVHLTEIGQTYLDCLTDAFDRIEIGTEKLMQLHAQQRLNIFCSMTLTMRWLVPRLGRFHAKYPSREICMNTPIPNLSHLRSGRSSVAVRMGNTDWEETTNERLFDIKLIPVCSPEFLAKADGIKPETNLGSYTLLQSLARPADWDNWAASVGMALSDRSRLHFESSSLAYEAALRGVGIAMGQLALVLDDLRSGRLVTLSSLVHSDDSYVTLSARPEFVRDPTFIEFRNWIRDEAATYVREQETFCAERGLQFTSN
jgi:LysR family glycine cleavage system transcriptional activator